MASYNAKEVQQLLNKHGYNLTVDGIIGDKTTAAIKDYQKNNGLTVDGIVGKNTYASLTKGSTNTTQKTTATTTPTSFKYSPSSATTQAETNKNNAYNALNSFQAYQPGTYQQSAELSNLWNQAQNMQKPTWDGGKYGQMTEDALNAYLNREDFSYDLNGDALYQQYKDKYMQQGKMASMDTMGQAAALTGGYGSSYASTVGNQAYQSYLQQLNDIVPELYQMAYDRYNQEGQDMLNAYSLVKDQYDTEYGQHRDSVGDYYQDKSNLLNMYGIKSDEEYGQWYDAEQMKQTANQMQYNILNDKYGNASNDFYNQREFDYGSQQDVYSSSNELRESAKSDVYALMQSGVMPSDAMLKAAGLEGSKAEIQAAANVYKKQADATIASKTASGSKSDSDDDSDNGNNPYGFTKDEIKEIQQRNGLTVDGIWGPKTQAAYEAEQNPEVTPTQTSAADKFIAMNMYQDEYLRRGHTFDEWKKYISNELAKASFTPAEFAYLEDFYNL